MWDSSPAWREVPVRAEEGECAVGVWFVLKFYSQVVSMPPPLTRHPLFDKRRSCYIITKKSGDAMSCVPTIRLANLIAS